MTAAVYKHFNPRRGILVPPKLDGKIRISGVGVAEKIMDQADELLDVETESWPLTKPPEVYMDLLQHRAGEVYLAWTVETTPEDADETDAGDADAAETDAADPDLN